VSLLAMAAIKGVLVVSVATGEVEPLGQLCSVNGAVAYTAAHVVEGETSLRWQTPTDEGALVVVAVNKEKDIAKLAPVGGKPFPYVQPLAPELPEPGDILWVSGWLIYADIAWYKTLHVFLGRRSSDGFITYQFVGHAGQSGGCVLNAFGEVQGIHLGGIRYPDTGTSDVGRGWPIWDLPKGWR
jgi:trypsin-like peptidase